MAAGGILLSLLAPRLSLWPSPTCGSAPGSLLPACGIPGASSAQLRRCHCRSFLIGAGLGLLTVTLVTHLRRFVGASRTRSSPLAREPAWAISFAIFRASLPPQLQVQALSAGVLCLAGIGITLLPRLAQVEVARCHYKSAVPFYRVLAGFTALVWLDSAAFFIIQNTPALKAGTWQGHSSSLDKRTAASCCGAGQRLVLAAQRTFAGTHRRISCARRRLFAPARSRARDARFRLLSRRRLALLGRAGRLSIPARSRCFSSGAGPNGGMDLRDCRLDGLRNGNRDGPESWPCSAALCRCCRRGSSAAAVVYRTCAGRARELALTAFVMLAAFFGDRILHAVDPIPTTYSSRARPPGLHLRRMHSLPLPICAAQLL